VGCRRDPPPCCPDIVVGHIGAGIKAKRGKGIITVPCHDDSCSLTGTA
jgi:hypothetical protein